MNILCFGNSTLHARKRQHAASRNHMVKFDYMVLRHTENLSSSMTF